MNTENVTYCPKCEDAIPENSQFCDHCGYELRCHSETETVGREMMRMRLEGNVISPATRNVAISILISVCCAIALLCCSSCDVKESNSKEYVSENYARRNTPYLIYTSSSGDKVYRAGIDSKTYFVEDKHGNIKLLTNNRP